MPANDSWIYQGRDEKGRFGSGTSPETADSNDDPSRSNPDDAGLQRAQAIAYGAVGHLSPEERPPYSAHLDRDGLAQLSESIVAWSRASGLERGAFRQRFLDGAGRDEVVDHLRKAALGISSTGTPDQLRDAAGELAAAYRLIGPDRWPRFVANAHERTIAASKKAVEDTNAPTGATTVRQNMPSPLLSFRAESAVPAIPFATANMGNPEPASVQAKSRVPRASPTAEADPLNGVQLAGTPNVGASNSWYVNGGSGQMRFFGPDGLPALDIDSDHDHGGGIPHMHVWTPNTGGYPSRFASAYSRQFLNTRRLLWNPGH